MKRLFSSCKMMLALSILLLMGAVGVMQAANCPQMRPYSSVMNYFQPEDWWDGCIGDTVTCWGVQCYRLNDEYYFWSYDCGPLGIDFVKLAGEACGFGQYLQA